MLLLISGLIIFFAVHMISNARGFREGLITRFGEMGYKGLFSLVSLLGLVLIIYGFGQYRAGGYIELWQPPKAFMHMNMLFSTLALIAIEAAYMPAGFIKTRLKHPFLVGIKLWAFGHLLANGDLGSMLIFGSFLAYSVINRIQVKKRGGRPLELKPFGLGDVLSILLGVGISLALIFGLHKYLIGVSAL
jgi:uncharacterized membrane protein